MESVLFLWMSMYLCDSNTMQTGYGERCVMVVEKRFAPPYRMPTKFGMVKLSDHSCRDGIFDGKESCLVTRLVPISEKK